MAEKPETVPRDQHDKVVRRRCEAQLRLRLAERNVEALINECVEADAHRTALASTNFFLRQERDDREARHAAYSRQIDDTLVRLGDRIRELASQMTILQRVYGAASRYVEVAANPVLSPDQPPEHFLQNLAEAVQAAEADFAFEQTHAALL